VAVLRLLIDVLPWWALFATLAAILLLATETTYQLGLRRRGHADAHKKSHAGLILASLFALLGLLLAFSFSIADGRFQTRKELVLAEANAIQTTYLRSDMLPPERIAPTKELLTRYTDILIDIRSIDEVPPALEATRAIHQALWAEAVASGEEAPWSRYIPLFVQSLNEVIDLQESRLTYAEYYRLPVPILWSLFAVTVVSMAVLGYVSGLGGTRSFWPTLAIVFGIVAVLVLIVELDRPWERLFEVSRSSLIDVRESMSNTAGNNR
jgi:hypothetical protein